MSILGGDSIGDCKKKSSYKCVSNSEWLPRQNCLNSTHTKRIVIHRNDLLLILF